MRFFSFLLVPLLVTISFSCAPRRASLEKIKPELVSINLVDRNGMSETISQKERLKQYSQVNFFRPQPYQKVLQVFSRDMEGSIRAFITSYYPNGQIKQYLEVKDNRAFGSYREWFLDGTLKLETYIIGGVADLNITAEKSWLFDGCSKVYDEEGHLIAKIEYVKGELSGISHYYHKNGNIWKIVPFRKNKMEGTFKTFLENGELLQTSDFANNQKEGKTIRYWECNKIAADEFYLDGLLKTGYYYDLSGHLVAKIEEGEGFRAVFGKNYVSELHEYHEGILNGVVQVFDQDSCLVKIYRIKNELKHGEEIEFHQNPFKKKQPKISIFWSEGKIQGLVKTWYENGIMESQREMTNNMKNGLLTCWYENGSLMLLEYYDHDKLQRGQYFKKDEKMPISELNEGTGLVTLHDSQGNLLKKINYFKGRPQD